MSFITPHAKTESPVQVQPLLVSVQGSSDVVIVDSIIYWCVAMVDSADILDMLGK